MEFSTWRLLKGLAAIGGVLGIVSLTLIYFIPAPPSKVVMATAFKGASFDYYGRQYRHPENARREGKSTPRSVTVCELNIPGGVNTTNHLGSGECNARAGVGFKHAYDILFQQVDRHRQQNDILH
jgi:hypothetical protein